MTHTTKTRYGKMKKLTMIAMALAGVTAYAMW